MYAVLPLYDTGVYGIGDDIKVTATFSQIVTVTGSPQLELDVGGTAKAAAYDSTDGSKVVFSYTVAEGDSDTDGVAISANKLTLNGGSIQESADNSADLSHSALSAQSGHKADGIRPTITRAPHAAASTFSLDRIHIIGEAISTHVAFSEDVVTIGTPQLSLNVGDTTKSLDFSPIPPNKWRDDNLHFLYWVAKGDLDLDGVSVDANALSLNGATIKDTAGNDVAVLTHAAAAAPSQFAVDGVPATVSSIEITSDPGSDETYGAGGRVEVTVTMTEDVIVSSTYPPELTLDIGGSLKRAVYRSENAGKLVFSYVVQDGVNDDNGISFPENSVRLSNGGTTGSYTVSDATGTSPFGSNPADLSFNAVAADSGHKVATSVQPPASTDATLSGLTLSGVDFGAFTSGTTSYWVHVAYSVSETTVTPTLSDSGASYVIKNGSRIDYDGIISLSPNARTAIYIVVTAEDDYTRQTYTVDVVRPGLPLTDAALSGLTLSGVDLGAFTTVTSTVST